VLTRRFGDFAMAEDATQEALLAALTQWTTQAQQEPVCGGGEHGVPDNPRGWLIQVGYRRMIEQIRAEQARRRREQTAARQQPADRRSAPPADAGPAGDRDDTLTVLFLCCHPVLSTTSAIALTLRAVGGLSTAEIARAFLVPEPTMAQRISRAKLALMLLTEARPRAWRRWPSWRPIRGSSTTTGCTRPGPTCTRWPATGRPRSSSTGRRPAARPARPSASTCWCGRPGSPRRPTRPEPARPRPA
jgi:DNA-directed RNA polymerase specialized sigma24 family protein